MAPSGDNVVVSSQSLEKLLSMKGGKGEASYANNCQAQVNKFIFLDLFEVLVLLDFFSLGYQKMVYKQNFRTEI